MGLTPPQRQPGCPGGQEKTVTATGVIRCFEEGEHWAEKGGGGELERGWKRVALERGSGTAPEGRGPSAGEGNDPTGDGGKPGGSDGRKEDREMRRQEQRGQRRARAR